MNTMPFKCPECGKSFSSKRALRIHETESHIKIKRAPTGVPGMDEILFGGIPESSLVLLAGTCGTGKTTFGFQFLLEGAKRGEPGVYISLEEEPERLVRDARRIGLDIKGYVDDGTIQVIRPELYRYDSLVNEIETSIHRTKAKRLVIDSITILGSYFRDPFELRRNILDMNRLLKRLNVTTLAVSEIEEGSEKLSRFGVEEFSVDGVIILYYIKHGNTFIRAVSVRKMRSSNHSMKIHPIVIRDGGIEVFPSEEVFADI